MLLALLCQLLHFTISMPRVKRQWGPADFYQFEQWINYVNRPRQSQYSADGPYWGVGQYPTFNRNVQQHTAPRGWQLEQSPYWPHGFGRIDVYPRTPPYTQTRGQAPVLIETNVFRTNSLTPVPTSPPWAYGIPRHLQGVKAVQSVATVPSVTTTILPTTTEDEREQFIQTAVKEDIDRVAASLSTTSKPLSSFLFEKLRESEARINTRPSRTEPMTTTPATTTTITEVTTTTEITTTMPTTTTKPSTTTQEPASVTMISKTASYEATTSDAQAFPETITTTEAATSVVENFSTTPSTETTGFSNVDSNPEWTEGEPSPAFHMNTKSIPEKYTTLETTSTAEENPSPTTIISFEDILKHTSIETVTFPQIKTQDHLIPEAEDNSSVSPFITETIRSNTTTESLFEDVTKEFQGDFGLRSPPLPIDVLKKIQEIGVSIEKAPPV